MTLLNHDDVLLVLFLYVDRSICLFVECKTTLDCNQWSGGHKIMSEESQSATWTALHCTALHWRLAAGCEHTYRIVSYSEFLSRNHYEYIAVRPCSVQMETKRDI